VPPSLDLQENMDQTKEYKKTLIPIGTRVTPALPPMLPFSQLYPLYRAGPVMIHHQPLPGGIHQSDLPARTIRRLSEDRKKGFPIHRVVNIDLFMIIIYVPEKVKCLFAKVILLLYLILSLREQPQFPLLVQKSAHPLSRPGQIDP